MNKSEFISAIGNRTLKKDAEVKAVVDAAVAIIKEQLRDGEAVTIAGFGTFEVKSRAERQGINPRTGELLDIPAKKAPGFRAAKALKDAVNE